MRALLQGHTKADTSTRIIAPHDMQIDKRKRANGTHAEDAHCSIYLCHGLQTDGTRL